MLKLLENCESFQWDEGNSEKNWISHKVTKAEAEQVFFNKPVILSISKISKKEKRWYLLGKTDHDRKLFTVFTIRDTSIRIISARDMSKKEKEVYDEKIEKKYLNLKSEEDERNFWSNSDSAEYLNWENSELVSFHKLKPSTRTISLRLPESMLEDIKIIANKRDVPYQSLIKIMLKERIDREYGMKSNE